MGGRCPIHSRRAAPRRGPIPTKQRQPRLTLDAPSLVQSTHPGAHRSSAGRRRVHKLQAGARHRHRQAGPAGRTAAGAPRHGRRRPGLRHPRPTDDTRPPRGRPARRPASPAPLRAHRHRRRTCRRRDVPRRGDRSRLLAVASHHGVADTARRRVRLGPAAQAARPFGNGSGSGSGSSGSSPFGTAVARTALSSAARSRAAPRSSGSGAPSDVTSIASTVDPALVDINVTLGYSPARRPPRASC